MSKIYAVYNDNIILNVVLGNSKESVEESTGMKAILCDDAVPWINWTLEEEGWRKPSPYLSWIWSGTEWIPPVSMPETGAWTWDEPSLSWIETVL